MAKIIPDFFDRIAPSKSSGELITATFAFLACPPMESHF
jgi:hypothetical protein